MKRTRILVSITVATMLAAAAAEAGAAAPTMSSADSTSAAPASRPDGDLEAAEATETGSRSRAEVRAVRSGPTSPSDAADTAIYLIRLVDPAVPSYRGGEPGLAATEPAPGQQLDPASAPARAYRGHLEAVQAEFIERLERTAGRSVEIPFTYQYAVNGIAAVLTAEEALAIAADPAVASIAPDQVRELHTDVGPQWAERRRAVERRRRARSADRHQGRGHRHRHDRHRHQPEQPLLRRRRRRRLRPHQPPRLRQLPRCLQPCERQLRPDVPVQRQAHRRLQLHRRSGGTDGSSTTTATAPTPRRPRAATSSTTSSSPRSQGS